MNIFNSFKQLFIAVVFVLTTPPIVNATVVQPGWVPSPPVFNTLVSITNRGDQGGELTVSCNKETKNLVMTYSLGGKQYDFFFVRNFGDIDQEPATKLLIGSGATSQATTYYNLMRNDRGFIVGRFPIGTKANWDKAIQEKSKVGPDMVQEGEEFFISGPEIKGLLNNLAAVCRFNPEDQTPIF